MTTMAALLHKKQPHIQAGTLLTGLAWRWSILRSRFSGKPPVLTRETAGNANQISIYNNSKWNKFFPHFYFLPVKQSIEQMVINPLKN